MTAETSITPETVTIREACAILGVSDKTMRRRIKKHKLLTSRQYANGTYTLLLLRQDVEGLVTPGQQLARIRRHLVTNDQADKGLDTFKETVKGQLQALDQALKMQAAHNRTTRRRILALACAGVVALVVLGAVTLSLWTGQDRDRGLLSRSAAEISELRGDVQALRAKLEASAAEKAKRSRLFGIF